MKPLLPLAAVLLASCASAQAVARPVEYRLPVPQVAVNVSLPAVPYRPAVDTASIVAPVRIDKEGVEQWRSLVSEYQWDVEEALSVMNCESRGRWWVVNGDSGATGLFQIAPGRTEYLGPWANVTAAYAKWQAAGGTWTAWSAFGPCGRF